jgi:hypothetical protein
MRMGFRYAQEDYRVVLMQITEILPEMEAGAILSLPGGNGLDAEDSAEVESSEH